MATASGSYPENCEFESHRVNKICGHCSLDLPVANFNKNLAKKDGLQAHCRDCSHKRFKRYYAANREKQRGEISKRKKVVIAENKKRLFDYLSKHPCVDCGESDPIVLELDHVRGNKTMHVSRMLAYGGAWATIVNEIAKCDVRCANCHRRRTLRNSYRHKLSNIPG